MYEDIRRGSELLFLDAAQSEESVPSSSWSIFPEPRFSVVVGVLMIQKKKLQQYPDCQKTSTGLLY